MLLITSNFQAKDLGRLHIIEEQQRVESQKRKNRGRHQTQKGLRCRAEQTNLTDKTFSLNCFFREMNSGSKDHIYFIRNY